VELSKMASNCGCPACPDIPHQKSPCPRLGCEILILMDPMKRARHVAGTQELSVLAQKRYKLPKFKQSKAFGKTLRSPVLENLSRF